MELLTIAWDFFEQSGDIEGYMLYHELIDTQTNDQKDADSISS